MNGCWKQFWTRYKTRGAFTAPLCYVILPNTQNPAGKAAGAQAVSSEGKFTPATQTSVQGVSGGILEQEAQRLYAKENPPAQGTGYAATEMGRPSAPLGVSATQEDTPSSAVNPANASNTYTSETTEPEVSAVK